MTGFNAINPLFILLTVLIGIAALIKVASSKRGDAGYCSQAAG
jgi:hypothetical protein